MTKNTSLFVLLTFALITIGAHGKQPRWDNKTLDFTKVETALSNEPVVSIIPMADHLKKLGHKADFYGSVFFVILKNGVQAVFKPLPPTDYPDAYAEVAAYKASQFLELYLVPPVVLRTINGKFGSLQFYVTPSIDALSFESFDDLLQELSPKQQHDIKVFCFLMGQWDYGRHNIILQKNGNVYKAALIDNAGIKNHQKWRLGNHPFVRTGYFESLNTNDWWGVPFPYDKAEVVQSDMTAIKKRFGNILPENFLKKLLTQGAHPVYFILWRNSFWRQFHQDDPRYKPLSIGFLRSDQKMRIAKMTEKVLNTRIFSHARKADFYNSSYIADLLDRRAHLLALPVQ